MESKKNYCTLYIVRHGQSLSNVEKIVAGHTNKPLSPEGEAQAKARAQDLDAVKFDVAFSSDLARAHKTAEIISLNRQLVVNTIQLLRERNFGEWESRPETEFLEENRHLLEKLESLSEQEKQDLKIGQGYESNSEIAQRFITVLREIAVTYLGKTVLVVSHGSIMRSLLMLLGFATYASLPSGSVSNTGYFVLESDGVDFFIKKTEGIAIPNKNNKTINLF